MYQKRSARRILSLTGCMIAVMAFASSAHAFGSWEIPVGGQTPSCGAGGGGYCGDANQDGQPDNSAMGCSNSVTHTIQLGAGGAPTLNEVRGELMLPGPDGCRKQMRLQVMPDEAICNESHSDMYCSATLNRDATFYDIDSVAANGGTLEVTSSITCDAACPASPSIIANFDCFGHATFILEVGCFLETSGTAPPEIDWLSWLRSWMFDELEKDGTCSSDGSIIGCEKQTLGEVIELTGVPYPLEYHSQHALGRTAENQVVVPVYDPNDPEFDPTRLLWSDIYIDLDGPASHAGWAHHDVRIEEDPSDDPLINANGEYVWQWDGTAAGSTSAGLRTASVTMTREYEYDIIEPGQLMLGPLVIYFATTSAERVTFTSTAEFPVGKLNRKAAKYGSWIGGWNFAGHHAYNPEYGVLSLSDGSQRRFAEPPDPVAVTGGPSTGYLIPSEDSSKIYVFNQDGRHLRTEDAVTRATLVDFVYAVGSNQNCGPNKHLCYIRDPFGKQTTIEYTNNQPTAIIGPYGQRNDLTLDGDGYLASVTNPQGRVHTATYESDPDKRGLLKTYVTPAGAESQFCYDDLGRLEWDVRSLAEDCDDPAGQAAIEAGDGWYKRLVRTNLSPAQLAADGLRMGYSVSLTTAEGTTQTHQVAILDNDNFERTITDAAGLETRSVRTADGERHKLFRPDGTVVITTFGENPRFGDLAPFLESIKTRTPIGPGPFNFREIVTDHTRAITPANPGPNDGLDHQIDIWHTTSDVAPWDIRQSSASIEALPVDGVWRHRFTSPEQRTSVADLDEFGRYVTRYSPSIDGRAVLPMTYEYDTDGRLEFVRQGDRETQYGYVQQGPAEGMLEAVMDASGRWSKFGYNASLQRTHEAPVGANPMQHYRTRYDVGGHLDSIEMPEGGRFDYQFTPFGLQELQRSPAVGGERHIRSFEYDREHRLVNQLRSDQLGWTRSLENVYASGRLDHRRLSELSGDFQSLTSYCYDNKGRPSGVIHQETEQPGTPFDLPDCDTWAGTWAAEFGYQQALPKTAALRTSHWELLQTYAFDDWLRPRTTTGSVAGHTYSHTVDYDDDGRVEASGLLSLTLDSDSGAVIGTQLGAVHSTIYHTNEFGEVTSRAVFDQASASAFYSEGIEYTDDGELDLYIEQTPGRLRVSDYTYDARGFLASAVVFDSTASGDATTERHYCYDLDGNRTSVHASDAACQVGVDMVSGAQYDNQGRITAHATFDSAGAVDVYRTFGYDGLGQITSDTSGARDVTYEYSARDQLKRATVVEGAGTTQVDYETNHLGQLLRRTQTDVTTGAVTRDDIYVYSGSSVHPIARLDGSGGFVEQYVYVTRSHVPDYVVTADNRHLRVITDRIGTPVALVDASTSVVEAEFSNGVWGQRESSTNPGGFPFGFAGGLEDSTTGLVRFGARWYDPSIGRWTQTDPIWQAGGRNIYQYANNDPVNLIDPRGRVAQFGALALMGLGAALNGYGLYSMYKTSQDPCLSIGQKAFWVGVDLGMMLFGGKLFQVGFRSMQAMWGATLNFGGRFIGQNWRNFRNARQGMSGLFDHATGNVFMKPSSPSATRPWNWVAQRRGHAQVREAYETVVGESLENAAPGRLSGFSITRGGKMGWNSGQINTASHGNRAVPEHLRQEIQAAAIGAIQ